MRKSKLIAAILAFAFSFSSSLAQEVIPASGGDASGSETTIPMTGLVPAVYFLKIQQTNPVFFDVKTFRIVKN